MKLRWALSWHGGRGARHRAFARVVCVLGLLHIAGLSVALAHPLGDDSITHITVLWPYSDRVEVELFIDIAEIPCMRALLEMDTNQDGEDSRAEQETWLTNVVERYRQELTLTLNGEPAPLSVAEAILGPDGASAPPYLMIKDVGNLPGLWTLKILVRYTTPLPDGAATGPIRLAYEDRTYPDTRGLKRVLIERSDEVRVDQRDVKFVDEGDPFAYEEYDPLDMPQERKAEVTFTVITAPTSAPTTGPTQTIPSVTIAGRALEDVPSGSGQAGQARRTADRILDRVGGGLTPSVLLAVSALCFGYGAWHALMPGHAKTVVAAYLISQRGRPRHAVVLALTVTATHTFIVYVMMAVIARFGGAKGSALQLWLGVVSGAIIMAMGLWLGFRAVTGRLGEHHHHHPDANTPWWKKLFTHSHPDVPGHHHHHDHEHAHDHDHAHAHDHSHAHSHGDAHHHDHTHAPNETAKSGGQITAGQILVLGISGGIVPCPTATFLGLGLISYNVFLAFYLVTVFSLGLALTLMLVGFAALLSNRFADRIMGDAGHHGSGTRWMTQILPALSSVAVVTIGGLMVANYLYWIHKGRALVAWLG